MGYTYIFIYFFIFYFFYDVFLCPFVNLDFWGCLGVVGGENPLRSNVTITS